MRALRAAAAAAALLGLAAGLLGQPARAFDETLILRVGTLDALAPMGAADLDDQRGGRMPATLPALRDTRGPVRLWDEIARPPRPVTGASAGLVTTVSRAAR